MTAPAAEQLRPAQVRLAVDLGGERRDIALRADVVVRDALQAALVPVNLPGVVVLDSTGRQLDLSGLVGAQLADGGVLHVVRPAPAPRTRAGRWAAGRPDVVTRRPHVEAGAFVLAATLGVVVALVLLLTSTAMADPAAAVVAAVLGLAAVAVALGRTAAPASATIAGPALGFAAGVLLIDPVDGPTGRLAVTVGLVVATVVAGVRLIATRAAGAGADDAGVVLVVVALAAAVQSAVLLAELPPVVAAAVVVGAAPLALRLLPTLSLSVPDEQLIDLAHVSRTAASVRSPRPRALGRVNERQVGTSVGHAERRKATATVVLSVLPPALLPVVLVAAEPGTVPGVGALVLSACVVVALVLGPRSARGSVGRWVPRAAAAVVLVELALGAPLEAAWRVPVAVVALVLVAGLAALSIALGSGWRSVVASRLADALEGLAVVLALPAALVAADMIETLRRVTSG
ncbi:MAG: hypothetical protein ABWY33_10355 [Cellulomonas sp.]